MESKAIAKCRYMRSTPQKVRLLADMIRGKRVVQAMNILDFSNKRAAFLVKKVLRSAIANAEKNFGLDVNNLKIIKICVDVGPTIKRIMPRAKGRADHFLKRTSHITIVISY